MENDRLPETLPGIDPSNDLSPSVFDSDKPENTSEIPESTSDIPESTLDIPESTSDIPGKGRYGWLRVVISIFVILVSVAFLRFFPEIKRSVLLRHSSLAITFPASSSELDPASIRYSLTAKNGKVTLTVSYHTTSSDKSLVPWKTQTGQVESSSYAEILDLAEESAFSSRTGKEGERVELEISGKKLKVEAQFAELMKDKLRELARVSCDNSLYPELSQHPDFSLVSPGLADDSKVLLTVFPKVIYFNRLDGELIVSRVSSGSFFELGKGKILSADPSGQCLVLEKVSAAGSGLIYWEKRMLHNEQVVIVEDWEVDPAYRKIIASGDNAYFTVPGEGGTHPLMRFSYNYRQSFPVSTDNRGYLKDITPDGKYLLMVEPTSGGSMSGKVTVVEASTGRTREVPGEITSNGTSLVFSFFRDEHSFIVYTYSGIIEIRGGEKQFGPLIRLDPEEINHPVAIDPGRTKLLFRDQKSQRYYVYDFPTEKILSVSSRGMYFSEPVFSSDGKFLFFIRFGDLFRWKPGDPPREKNEGSDKEADQMLLIKSRT